MARSAGAGKGNQLAVAAVMAPRDERTTLDIQRISNGYLITRSERKGDVYRETKTFSPTAPRIDIAKPKRR